MAYHRVLNKPAELNSLGQSIGGRVIRETESPNGEPIEAGSTFVCDDAWLAPRRHWHFLKVLDTKCSIAQLDAPEQELPEDIQALVAELAKGADGYDYNKVKSILSGRGEPTSGNKATIFGLASDYLKRGEFESASEPEEDRAGILDQLVTVLDAGPVEYDYNLARSLASTLGHPVSGDKATVHANLVEWILSLEEGEEE